MNHIGRLLLAFLLAAGVGGCSRGDHAAAAPLAGARLGGPFTLTDQNGRRITDAAFAGRYRIVYFGYTFCPDVCPLDMQTVGAAMRLLDASDPGLSAKLVPIFISVDPARDTPAVLKAFVAAFYPRMVGLTGTDAEIAAVAKAYAVYYQKAPPSPGGGYMVAHSRVGYLMGPNGAPVALLPVEKTPQDVAAELRRWVK